MSKSLLSNRLASSVARIGVLLGLIGVFTVALIGCSGSTGGEDENYNGSSFDGDNSGRMELVLRDDDMLVGEFAGFFVQVFDANEQPVADIRISCDTEDGLALIEPSDGQQITDGGGVMSGKIGCAQVGSFRVGCRLPVGSGRRQFATVTCSGPIPAGFDGFPGAGGGGLGGGSVNEPIDGGEVSITSIAFFDLGDVDTGYQAELGDLQVDVSQGLCGDPPDQDPEPFFDTVMGIDVENFLDGSVNFSRYSYTVTDSDGNGTPFSSQEFALINADEVEGQGSNSDPGQKRFLAYFAKAGAGKFLNGASSALPASNWISNLTVRLFGVSSTGEDVEVSLRVAIAFGTYDNCGA